MIPINGTIEDLIEILEDIRIGIPAKKELTEEEVRSRLEGRPYGILKIADLKHILCLWRLV